MADIFAGVLKQRTPRKSQDQLQTLGWHSRCVSTALPGFHNERGANLRLPRNENAISEDGLTSLAHGLHISEVTTPANLALIS